MAGEGMKFEFFASYEPKPDWKSGGIMLATGCKFSHVGIIVNEEHIYHATGIGFNEEHIDEFLLTHQFAHRFELMLKDDTPFGHGRALGWLQGNIGKDYSETQFLGFGAEFVERYLPAFLVNKIKSLVTDGMRELVCSESVVRFGLEHCGLVLEDGHNPDFDTPEESVTIMQAVKKHAETQP